MEIDEEKQYADSPPLYTPFLKFRARPLIANSRWAPDNGPPQARICTKIHQMSENIANVPMGDRETVAHTVSNKAREESENRRPIRRSLFDYLGRRIESGQVKSTRF